MAPAAAVALLAEALGISLGIAGLLWAFAGAIGVDADVRRLLESWQETADASARNDLRVQLLALLLREAAREDLAARLAAPVDVASVRSRLAEAVERLETDLLLPTAGVTTLGQRLENAIAVGAVDLAVELAAEFVAANGLEGDEADLVLADAQRRAVAVAQRNIAAAGVAAPAAPPLEGQGLEELLRQLPQLIGSGLALAIGGAGAGTLTDALSSFAGRQHNERVGSMATTAQRLGQVLAAGLPAVGLAAFLANPSAARDGIRDQITALVGALVDRGELPQPMIVGAFDDPSRDALAAAVDMVLDRIVYGLEAHAVATTAEQFAPLKRMGFNQVAAFLSDLAGFQRLATAMMAPYEFSGITQPLRLDANARFRTNLPNERDIGFFYAKKELTPSQMAHFLAQNGLSDFWVRVNELAMFLDPRAFELVRIGQFFQPALTPELRAPTADVVRWWSDREEWVEQFAANGVTRDDLLGTDWWWYYKLSKSGYELTDVIVLKEVVKRATARREQTLFLDAATRLYRDGFIGDARLQELVDEAWELADPKAARIRATQLATEATDRGDLRSITLRLVSRGALTADQARERLLEAGMRPEKIEFELARERLGLIPRVSVRQGDTYDALLDELESEP